MSALLDLHRIGGGTTEMAPCTVRILDTTNRLIALVTITEETDRFGGTIDLTATPPTIRSVFQEFEEVVNGQMFSFLDEVEAKVAALQLTGQFSDGSTAPIVNLQVYPTTGEVWFQLAAPVTAPSP